MVRNLLGAALLLVACGGSEDAVFDNEPGAPQGGSASSQAGSGGSGGEDTSGSAGETSGEAGSGGSEPVGGGAAGGMPGTGGVTQGGSGGGTAQGGAGGPAAGSGGTESGAAGKPTGGGAGSGAGGHAGSGGSQPEPVCKAEGWMDCNGTLGDGTNHVPADDCETPMSSHDNCGMCGKKCGVTQECKSAGSPGNWTYFCTSK